MSLLPFSENRERLEIPAPLFKRITMIPEAVNKLARAEERYGAAQKVGSHFFNTAYTPMLEKRSVPVAKTVFPQVYEAPTLLDKSNEPVPLPDVITEKEISQEPTAPILPTQLIPVVTEQEARIQDSLSRANNAATLTKDAYDHLAKVA